MPSRAIRGVSFGDPHANCRSPRWEQEIVAFERLATAMVADKPDLFLGNGDFAGRETDHRYLPPEVVVLGDLFARLLEVCPGFICRGNHDRLGELGVFGPLGSKGRHPLHIADYVPRTVNIRIGDDSDDWVSVRQVPYISEAALYHACSEEPPRGGAEATVRAGDLLAGILAKRPIEEPFYCIGQCHFPYEGVQLGPYEVERSQDVTIPKGALDEEKTSIQFWGVGHIHKRMQIAPNAWYSGSHAPRDYGESGAKGYIYFEIDPEGRLTVEERNIQTWDMVTSDIGNLAGADLTDWTLWVKPAEKLVADLMLPFFVKLRYELPAGIPQGAVPMEKITEELKRRGALGVDFDPTYARLERNERAPEVTTALTDEKKVEVALDDVSDDERADALRLFAQLVEEVPCAE